MNQQLSTKAAAAIWSRIEAVAVRLEVTPRAVFASGHEATLRTCGVSGNKVRALQAICDAEAAGLLTPELAALPHAERSVVLCSIRGVGRWTADMIGIFHFLDPDIWPLDDIAAVGCLRRLIGCQDTHEIATRFAPYRSILARYTWRVKNAASIVVAFTISG